MCTRYVSKCGNIHNEDNVKGYGICNVNSEVFINIT